MEYLKSNEQIELEIKQDEEQINKCLFPDYDDLDDRCPVCLRNYPYRDWWTCKECSKNLSVKEYIEEMIKHFG